MADGPRPRSGGVSRRNLLALMPAALAARVLPGCDRLVVLDGAPPLDGIDPITSSRGFYIYSYGPPPEVDPETHRMRIVGEDGDLADFDLAFLHTLPARVKELTLECVGAGPTVQNIGNGRWTGVPLRELLDALGVEVPPEAVGLRLVGADDYHAGVPIEDLDGAPIWIVWELNGEPLHPLHGAPARLLVPGRYGMKNLKWIREIAFVREPHASYWTEFGWSEPAPYRPNTFVVSPIDGFEVEVGKVVRVLGTAYAGSDPVEAVEIAIDGGDWKPCDLDYAPELADVWVLWSFVWRPRAKGYHTLQVRCTTASGARSAADPEGTDHYAGYDGSMQIRVRAS